VFEVGDAVVHPIRGAGVVTDIEELQRQGSNKAYYKIKLLSEVPTSLMIPVEEAKKIGLRYAIRQSKLNRVWSVLHSDPKKLPSNYKARYKVVESKLRTGDPLQIAEAVRDMAWRQKKKGSLNTRGRRMHKKGMRFLAGEIAATQGIDLTDGEDQLRCQLRESLSPKTAM
jgi:CarD family transcriptional regulator